MAVCLHCLHEARLAARDRRHRAIMRLGAWTVTLSVVGVVGMAGVNAAMRPSAPPVPAKRVAAKPAAPPAAAQPAPATPVSATPVMQQGAPAEVSPTVADTTLHGGHPATSAPPTPATVAAAGTIAAPTVPDSSARPTPALGPIVGHGRTDLGDSLFATRSGDVVVVHFDTPPKRTRRADKFEAVVRQTLKAVYGAIADSALATVPVGQLTAPNELLTTLPKRGIHLTGPRGIRIAVWPETRAGQDGPLAVAYRTVVER